MDFFSAALHPRLDGQFLRLTAHAMLTTLAYAALGTALSLVIGLVGGVFTSQTWWRSRLQGLDRVRLGAWTGARAALALPRGIHEVVWGLFFLSVFGLEPVVAVLAIGIPFGAVTAKVFAEILDETGQRPYSALLACGASRHSAMMYGLLPPALPDLLSYSFYRFECAIRSAALLGFVGAGGLGYQLQLSFQTLLYEEMWTLLYALILLSGLADIWSSAVRRRHLTRSSALVALALIPVSAVTVGLDVSVLWEARTWQVAGQILADAWPPGLGPEGIVMILELSAITLAMSILGIAIAFAGGAVLAFLAAANAGVTGRTGQSWVVRAWRALRVLVARGMLLVFRAIPPPVWAVLCLFLFYPGIIPGALALGLYTLGVLGRLMAEAAENLDARPLRALRTQGASGLGAFLYGVLPSATPRFVAYGLYRWEVTIRETVVVGVVGAGGLGLLLDQQLASFDYGGALATLTTLIMLTLLVDLASAAVRRSLR